MKITGIKWMLILLLFSRSIGSYACLNEYYYDRYGEVSHWTSPMPVFYKDQDTFSARAFINKYGLDNIEQYNFGFQSDIAVKLSYLGEFKKALEILIRLEKQHPDEYRIAANLGTLYELNGMNHEALQFIKKAMQINPEEHEGSEWVHVKILEAKIAMEKDHNWLAKHRVLNTGIGFDSKRTDDESRAKQISDIEYQLQERLPFTKFPDAVMANVLNELGDLYGVEASAEMAYVAYELAGQNNGDKLYGLTAKKAKLALVLKKHRIPIPDWHYHYHSRYESEGEAFLKKKASDLSQIQPDQVINAVKSLSDHFNNEDKVRAEKIRSRNLMLIIIGSLVLLVAVVLFIFMRRKEKKQETETGPGTEDQVM